MNRERTGLAACALAVLVVTVWLHWPCLRNGFVNWDDRVYLDEVVRLGRLGAASIGWAFSALEPFYYHPLTWLSHLVDYQLWGMNPTGHHAVNLLLHGLNAALVTLFAYQVLGGAGNGRVAGAVLSGLVFGLHPLQVESVAWVAERKNVLCGFFSLCCLCAYLRWGGRSQRRRWWWATVAFLAAALLSKPMAVSLPVVMLALDLFPLRRGVRVREKLLPFAMAAFVAVLTVLPQHRQGALALAELDAWERVLVAMRSVTFYLWKLVWPAWLSPFYPLGTEVSIRQREFWVPVAVFVVVTGLCVWARRRAPGALAGWAGYLALVLPVSGLVQAGSQAVADRFAYLAMLGPVLVAAGAAARLPVRARAVALALAAVAVVWFAVRTREQIGVWRDDVTLWSSVIRFYPGAGLEYRYLAQALLEQQRYEEALSAALVAAAAVPEDERTRALVGFLRGRLAEQQLERWELAGALSNALEATRWTPADGRARALLGLIYLKQRSYAEAAVQLEEALRLEPELPAARYNLACAYARLQRFERAYEMLREAIAREPQYAALAGRDPELAALREHPVHGAAVRALLGGAGGG